MSLDDLYEDFVEDTAPLVTQLGDRLAALERAAEAMVDEWQAAMGLLHTIKGNCGMMRLTRGEKLAHAMEQRAKAAQEATVVHQPAMVGPLLTAVGALEREMEQDATETVPVDLLLEALARPPEGGAANPEAARAAIAANAPRRVSHLQMSAATLDRLLELAGELATCHGQAHAAVSAAADKLGSSDEITAGVDALEALGKHVSGVRQRVLDARLVPLRAVVGRLDRLVRDLAQALGKNVSLVVEGAETVVDKSIADQISEPLLHILRNAVDHGVEDEATRREAGKRDTARIDLRIVEVGSELEVSVADDGRGISLERLSAAAHERGLDTSGWSDADRLDLVFAADVSTAERVTELSGRGVGMGQVRRAVERMGGVIDLASEPGRGTRFRMRVPLAAAIRRVLLVRCAGERYAIPIEAVAEVFPVAGDEVYALDRGFVTAWRSGVLSARYLAEMVSASAGPGSERLLCVVVRDEARALGLLIDQVIGQQDVVVKELDPALGRPRGLSGVALVHDGSAVMILDPRGLVHAASTTSARGEPAASGGPA